MGGGFSALSALHRAAEVTPATGGGSVLPANATPHGYSLADMTQAVAQFTTSGNKLAYYPNTPFQILYFDASRGTGGYTVVNGTDLFTGTTSFTGSNAVPAGTTFFVPIINVDDSPPVVGTFPTDASKAADYFFDPKQVGGRNFEIIVDGKTTPIGPSYVAFATTAPLQDGGGTHIITIGAFITPLSVGTHTVEIKGELAGQAVRDLTGGLAQGEDITYTVQVVPHGHL